VGDAAGLVDPLVGEGIRYAMTSGRLAAEAIASAGGGDLRRVGGYEEALWHEVGHSLATAGLAANVYYHLPHVSYRLGVCNLAAIRHVVDIITDDQSYIGIGRRLVFATLRWPLDVVRRRRRDKRSRDTISERSNE
jgi:flavin-dependent dehydrogenase